MRIRDSRDIGARGNLFSSASEYNESPRIEGGKGKDAGREEVESNKIRKISQPRRFH